MNTTLKKDLAMLALLAAAVVSTALVLVYVKHMQRQATTELADLERERAHLDVEWSRLQLEESAAATPGLVERVARERISMRLPVSDDVRVLRPDHVNRITAVGSEKRPIKAGGERFGYSK